MIAPAMHRSVAAAVGVIALVAALLAGCSGDDAEPPTVTAVVDATVAAGPASVTGTTGDAEVRGAFDAEGERASLAFPVEVAGAPVDVEVRVAGDDVFVRRAEADAATLVRAGVRAAFLHVAGDPPFLQLVRANAAEIVGPVDPVAALRALPAGALEPADGDAPDGATRYRYTPEGGNATIAGASPFALPPGATLDLLVDDDGTLVGWEATGDGMEVRLSFARGGTVAGPPGDEEVASTDTRPVDYPEPTGSWTEAGAGEAGGVAWRLERADGEAGTTCWQLVTEPPVPHADETVATANRCVEPPDEGAGPDEWATSPFVAGEGPAEAIVGLVPAGTVTAAEAWFAGGGRAPAQVVTTGAAADAVVYVGPPEQVVGMLVLTDPDGGSHDCVAQQILDRAELRDLSADAVRTERVQWPWSCIPGD